MVVTWNRLAIQVNQHRSIFYIYFCVSAKVNAGKQVYVEKQILNTPSFAKTAVGKLAKIIHSTTTISVMKMMQYEK